MWMAPPSQAKTATLTLVQTSSPNWTVLAACGYRKTSFLCLYSQVVGLYRLCGSAAVKKELRDAFEQDSAAVCLSEDVYPDINVITGQRSPFPVGLFPPTLTSRPAWRPQ